MSKYNAAFLYDLENQVNSTKGDIIISSSTGLCQSIKSTHELGEIIKEQVDDDDISDIAYGSINGYFMAVYDAIKKVNENANGEIKKFLNDSNEISKNVYTWICVWINIILASSKNQCVIKPKKAMSGEPLMQTVLSEWGKYLNRNNSELKVLVINGEEVAYVSDRIVICPKKYINNPENLSGYDEFKKRFTIDELMKKLNYADKSLIKSYFKNNVTVEDNAWGNVADKYYDCARILNSFINDKFNNVNIKEIVVPKISDIPMLEKLNFAGNDEVFTDNVLIYQSEDGITTYSLLPIKENFDIDGSIKNIKCIPNGDNNIKFILDMCVMGVSYELTKTYDKSHIINAEMYIPFIAVYPNFKPELRKYYKKYQWVIKKNNNAEIVDTKIPDIKIKNLKYITQSPKIDNEGIKNKFSFDYAFTDDYPDYIYITCDGKDAGCFCLKNEKGNEALIFGQADGYNIPAKVPDANLQGKINAGIDFGTGNTQVVYQLEGIGVDPNKKLWNDYNVRHITPLPENMSDFGRLYYVQEPQDYPESDFPTFIQFNQSQPNATFDMIPYAAARIPFFTKEIIDRILELGDFKKNGIYGDLKFGTNGTLGTYSTTAIYIFLKNILMELIIIAIKNRSNNIDIKVSYPINSIKAKLTNIWGMIIPDVIGNMVNGINININSYIPESVALCKYIIKEKVYNTSVPLPDSHMIILDLGQGTADLSYVAQSADATASSGKKILIHGQMSVQFAGSRIIFDSIIKFFSMCKRKDANLSSDYVEDMWKCPSDEESRGYRNRLNISSWIQTEPALAYNFLSMLISEFGFDNNSISNNAKYKNLISIIKFKYLILIKTVSAFINHIINQATQEEVKVQLLLYGGASRAFNLIIPGLKRGTCIQDTEFGRILQSVIDPSSENLIEDGMTIEYMTSSQKYELAQGLLYDDIKTDQLVREAEKVKSEVKKSSEVKKRASEMLFGKSDHSIILDKEENSVIEKISFEGFKNYIFSLVDKVTCEIDGEDVDIMEYIISNGVKEDEIETSLRKFFTSKKGDAYAYMKDDKYYPEIKAQLFYMYLTNILLNERL